MARWRMRRLTNREYRVFGTVAALVVVAFVIIWVVIPWLSGWRPSLPRLTWGPPKPAPAQARTESPSPRTVVVAEPSKTLPSPAPVPATLDDALAALNKTLDQNRLILDQNSKLIEMQREWSDSQRGALLKTASELERRVTRLEANYTVVRRSVSRWAEATRSYSYPVASRVEYVGCPCPPVR